MSLKPAIAIVDAYSSGALLAPAARERQHPCIMVQSTATIPPMYRPSFRAGDFDLIIGPRSSVAETCSELRRRNVAYVLAGSEMGVELADQISARMGLTTNGTRLSSARRNKSLMGDVLTPETFSSSRLNEIQDWIRQRQKWPVVIKPVESSGTDGVRLCTRESEVAAAFESIVNRTDVFGKPNESVLVQEYVRGPEYAVDTVSHDGRHRIAALGDTENERVV